VPESEIETSFPRSFQTLKDLTGTQQHSEQCFSRMTTSRSILQDELHQRKVPAPSGAAEKKESEQHCNQFS